MTYMVLAVVYLLVCAGLGLARGRSNNMNVFLTASLAAVMVCAQLALLLTR